MNKTELLQAISTTFRRLGLIKLLDYLHYLYSFYKSTSARKDFIIMNPTVKLPTTYALYETYKIDYEAYYYGGIDTAKWIISIITKYKPLNNLKILDWGCGVGRVVRHLPKYTNETCKIFGTDYNSKYINWSSENIDDITFNINNLYPPTNYDNEYFDVIYGISIFTHLSEELHKLWIAELFRILKTDGILILTLHGTSFEDLLTTEQKTKFYEGKLITKGKTKVGHRTYAAFHPKQYFESLLGTNTILEHKEGHGINKGRVQDLWVLQKK